MGFELVYRSGLVRNKHLFSTEFFRIGCQDYVAKQGAVLFICVTYNNVAIFFQLKHSYLILSVNAYQLDERVMRRDSSFWSVFRGAIMVDTPCMCSTKISYYEITHWLRNVVVVGYYSACKSNVILMCFSNWWRSRTKRMLLAQIFSSVLGFLTLYHSKAVELSKRRHEYQLIWIPLMWLETSHCSVYMPFPRQLIYPLSCARQLHIMTYHLFIHLS